MFLSIFVVSVEDVVVPVVANIHKRGECVVNCPLLLFSLM